MLICAVVVPRKTHQNKMPIHRVLHVDKEQRKQRQRLIQHKGSGIGIPMSSPLPPMVSSGARTPLIS